MQNIQSYFINDSIDAFDFIGLTEYYDESISMLKNLALFDFEYSYDLSKRVNQNKKSVSSRERQIIAKYNTKDIEIYKNNTLFINPGEICARNKPLTQCVLLTITQQQYIVEYYFKKPYTNNWQTKQFLYNRQTNEQ